MSAVIAKLKRYLPENKFVRKAGVLVGGTALSTVILTLASPLLTRLYTPEEFGTLAVFLSLLNFLYIIASLRYEMAIPLPRGHAKAANITVLAISLLAVTTVIVSLLVWLFGENITSFFNAPKLRPYLWLLPIGIVFLSAFQIFSYWAIRRSEFSIIAGAKIKQSIVTVILQVIGAKFGAVGLLFGHVGGQSIGALPLAKNALKRRYFQAVSLTHMKAMARRYKKFPLFNVWSASFNSAGQQMPPLLFAVYFDVAIAGFYVLANRVLALPMVLIGNAVGKVFLADAVIAHKENRLKDLVANVFKTLVEVGLPPLMILVVAGPQLFSLVFGDEWAQSGLFAQWMAIWLACVFIVSPLGFVAIVLEKQKQILVFETVLLVVRAICIIIGGQYGDITMTIMLFSLSSAVCWLGYLVWIMKITGNNLGTIIMPIVKNVLLIAAMLLPLIAAIHFSVFHWVIGLAISLGLIGVKYLLLLKKLY